LKADAEAAMEKLAAGFEKTESGLHTFKIIQIVERKLKAKMVKQFLYITKDH
jgi:hypothetical protein